MVGTTADFRRPGPWRPLPLNHLPGENRQTTGRIGEVRLIWFNGKWFLADLELLLTVINVKARHQVPDSANKKINRVARLLFEPGYFLRTRYPKYKLYVSLYGVVSNYELQYLVLNVDSQGFTGGQ